MSKCWRGRVLHDHELKIDMEVARSLIAAQVPEWSELPLRRVRSSGTANVLFRLGDDLVLRLPRLSPFSAGTESDAFWLPKLAPHLPLEIPECVFLGSPTDAYPASWAVHRWIEGENATQDTLRKMDDAAKGLAAFVLALRAFKTDDKPDQNYRGQGLAGRDAATRSAIDEVAGEFDRESLLRVWDSALDASVWDGIPTWFHGDLHSGNLLAHEGKLRAVIDFEMASTGDPSSDLLPAWWLFDSGSREVFRDALETDDASWQRGRGWALSIAVVALPYYKDSNPDFANMARRAIAEVIGNGEDWIERG